MIICVVHESLCHHCVLERIEKKLDLILEKEGLIMSTLSDQIDAKLTALEGKVDNEDADVLALRQEVKDLQAKIDGAPAGTPDSVLQAWSDRIDAINAKIDATETPAQPAQ